MDQKKINLLNKEDEKSESVKFITNLNMQKNHFYMEVNC